MKNVENLRFWCQKVLPLVYDDSLSYMELLNKVVKKLNEEAEAINEQNTVVQEVQQSQTEYEATMTERYQTFTNSINSIITAFESSITQQQDAYETSITGQFTAFVNNMNAAWETYQQDMSAQQTAFQNTMQTQYDDFLENYLSTLGVVQTTGTSITNVMSQKAVTDEVEQLANKEGYYKGMRVGTADNLAGKGEPTEEIYTYRTSGGTDSIATGTAIIKEVRGNAVGYNQGVQNGDFSSTATWNGIAGAITASNNEATFTTTINNSVSALATQIHVITNHKYYVSALIKPLQNMTGITWFALGTLANLPIYTQGESNTVYKKYSAIKTGSQTGTLTNYFQLCRINAPASAYRFNIKNCMYIDLTAMFGLGNEPATPEEFEAIYPYQYYPYNVGSAMFFEGTQIDTTGFNQIQNSDISALGNVTVNNGVVTQINPDTATSLNFKFVKYYNTTFVGLAANILQNVGIGRHFTTFTKDESFNVLRFGLNGASIDSMCSIDISNLINDNVYCISFRVINDTQGSVAWGNMCVNLSWSGYRNGEYEVYSLDTKNLPDLSSLDIIVEHKDNTTSVISGLKSAINAYDSYNETAITRCIGVIDLGIKEYTLTSTNVFKMITDYSSALPHTNNDIPNIFCAKYSTVSYNDFLTGIDKAITLNTDGETYIRDTEENSHITLEAHLDRVYLSYQKNTSPVVIPFTTPENLTYSVNDFGTEKIIAPTGNYCPCNMFIVYGVNAVDTIRTLPTNYISAHSLQNFMAALDTINNTTSVMSFDETTGAYTFTITRNEEII